MRELVSSYNLSVTTSLFDLYKIGVDLLSSASVSCARCTLDRSMAGSAYGSSIIVASLGVISAGVLLLPAQASSAHQASEPSAKDTPYVLHITAREVVIDLIAVDGHDRTVTDLAAAELTVAEKVGNSAETPEPISSLRLIDPNAAFLGNLPQNGFRVAANESCLQRESVHYQLVYSPGTRALIPGDHDVHIQTSRRGVRLFYRHGYFIGATAPAKNESSKPKAQLDRELQLDACSHPLAPLSISLRAAQISTGSKDTFRYKLNIENNSLAFVSFSDYGRGIGLDYGACNFDAAGQPLSYMTTSTDQILTPDEYTRAHEHGLQRILEFTPPANLAMTRFVVRDRSTGNLGLADVVVTLPEKPHLLDAKVQERLATQQRADFGHVTHHSNASDIAYFGAQAESDAGTQPLAGPVGSYGSAVPQPHTFCGDVFELKPGIRFLPDFRSIDSIGSIYTSSLAVPYQNLPPETGIPDVTDHIAWFGVDYRATFWITTSGQYDFELMSDDGAMLEIDDKRIVDIDGLHTPRKSVGQIELDAGRHTIHVPYFEGTPPGVALALWVRPPHGTWRVFDLHEFEEPSRKVE